MNCLDCGGEAAATLSGQPLCSDCGRAHFKILARVRAKCGARVSTLHPELVS